MTTIDPSKIIDDSMSKEKVKAELVIRSIFQLVKQNAKIIVDNIFPYIIYKRKK